MSDSEEINDKLDSILSRLDRLESLCDDISDATGDLQAQGAVMADDLAEIRRDIARLEPGVI